MLTGKPDAGSGGRVPVQPGTLKTLKVGHAMAKQIAVAFFAEEDAKDQSS